MCHKGLWRELGDTTMTPFNLVLMDGILLFCTLPCGIGKKEEARYLIITGGTQTQLSPLVGIQIESCGTREDLIYLLAGSGIDHAGGILPDGGGVRNR